MLGVVESQPPPRLHAMQVTLHAPADVFNLSSSGQSSIHGLLSEALA